MDRYLKTERRDFCRKPSANNTSSQGIHQQTNQNRLDTCRCRATSSPMAKFATKPQMSSSRLTSIPEAAQCRCGNNNYAARNGRHDNSQMQHHQMFSNLLLNSMDLTDPTNAPNTFKFERGSKQSTKANGSTGKGCCKQSDACRCPKRDDIMNVNSELHKQLQLLKDKCNELQNNIWERHVNSGSMEQAMGDHEDVGRKDDCNDLEALNRMLEEIFLEIEKCYCCQGLSKDLKETVREIQRLIQLLQRRTSRRGSRSYSITRKASTDDSRNDPKGPKNVGVTALDDGTDTGATKSTHVGTATAATDTSDGDSGGGGGNEGPKDVAMLKATDSIKFVSFLTVPMERPIDFCWFPRKKTKERIFEGVHNEEDLNITTAITRSGNVEVTTVSPNEIIESTLMFTKSGNVDVTTDIKTKRDMELGTSIGSYLSKSSMEVLSLEERSSMEVTAASSELSDEIEIVDIFKEQSEFTKEDVEELQTEVSIQETEEMIQAIRGDPLREETTSKELENTMSNILDIEKAPSIITVDVKEEIKKIEIRAESAKKEKDSSLLDFSISLLEQESREEIKVVEDGETSVKEKEESLLMVDLDLLSTSNCEYIDDQAEVQIEEESNETELEDKVELQIEDKPNDIEENTIDLKEEANRTEFEDNVGLEIEDISNEIEEDTIDLKEEADEVILGKSDSPEEIIDESKTTESVDKIVKVLKNTIDKSPNIGSTIREELFKLLELYLEKKEVKELYKRDLGREDSPIPERKNSWPFVGGSISGTLDWRKTLRKISFSKSSKQKFPGSSDIFDNSQKELIQFEPTMHTKRVNTALEVGSVTFSKPLSEYLNMIEKSESILPIRSSVDNSMRIVSFKSSTDIGSYEISIGLESSTEFIDESKLKKADQLEPIEITEIAEKEQEAAMSKISITTITAVITKEDVQEEKINESKEILMPPMKISKMSVAIEKRTSRLQAIASADRLEVFDFPPKTQETKQEVFNEETMDNFSNFCTYSHLETCDCLLCRCCSQIKVKKSQDSGQCLFEQIRIKKQTTSIAEESTMSDILSVETHLTQCATRKLSVFDIPLTQADQYSNTEVIAFSKTATNTTILSQYIETSHSSNCDCFDCLCEKSFLAANKVDTLKQQPKQSISPEYSDNEVLNNFKAEAITELVKTIKQAGETFITVNKHVKHSNSLVRSHVSRQTSSFILAMSGMKLALASLQIEWNKKDKMVAEMFDELKSACQAVPLPRLSSKTIESNEEVLSLLKQKIFVQEISMDKLTTGTEIVEASPHDASTINELSKLPDIESKIAQPAATITQIICDHTYYPNCPCVRLLVPIIKIFPNRDLDDDDNIIAEIPEQQQEPPHSTKSTILKSKKRRKRKSKQMETICPHCQTCQLIDEKLVDNAIDYTHLMDSPKWTRPVERRKGQTAVIKGGLTPSLVRLSPRRRRARLAEEFGSCRNVYDMMLGRLRKIYPLQS